MITLRNWSQRYDPTRRNLPPSIDLRDLRGLEATQRTIIIMKTIKQWYEDELPADIAVMAIKNAEEARMLHLETESLSEALGFGFYWQSSPQGLFFWDEVTKGNYGEPGNPIDYSSAVDLMEREGGSFASNLATTFRYADNDNRQKLINAFGDLFREYARRAKGKAAQC